MRIDKRVRRIRIVIVCATVILFTAGFFSANGTHRHGKAFGQDSGNQTTYDASKDLNGPTGIQPDNQTDISEKREAIVKSALSLIGTPYRFGGSDPRRGFDCCGFVMYVYKLNHITLPRTSGSQFLNGRYIEKKDARKGDLLFWHIPKGRISHVGIYIGEGKFVHSPVPGKRVRVESLDELYWRKYYFGAATYLE